MKIKYSGSRTYTLLNDRDHVQGTMKYPGMFSQKAVIDTPPDRIVLSPKTFSSVISLFSNDQQIGSLKMKWSGMSIELALHDNGKYTVQKKGFWKPYFILLDQDNVERVRIVPHFRWKTLHYDYQLEPHISERYKVDDLMLLIVAYCANYMQAVASTTT